jgi:hypothetical protein
MMPKVDDDNTPQKDDAKGSGIADREKTPRVMGAKKGGTQRIACPARFPRNSKSAVDTMQ